MNLPEVLGLLVAGVARTAVYYHPVQLPFVFVFVFNFCTIGTKVRHTVFFLSVGGIFIFHRLISNTYHTNGVNIPDFQPNYEYQYGMQQHLSNVII